MTERKMYYNVEKLRKSAEKFLGPDARIVVQPRGAGKNFALNQRQAFDAKANAEDPYLPAVPVRTLTAFDDDFPISGDHLTKIGAKRRGR